MQSKHRQSKHHPRQFTSIEKETTLPKIFFFSTLFMKDVFLQTARQQSPYMGHTIKNICLNTTILTLLFANSQYLFHILIYFFLQTNSRMKLAPQKRDKLKYDKSRLVDIGQEVSNRQKNIRRDEKRRE